MRHYPCTYFLFLQILFFLRRSVCRYFIRRWANTTVISIAFDRASVSFTLFQLEYFFKIGFTSVSEVFFLWWLVISICEEWGATLHQKSSPMEILPVTSSTSTTFWLLVAYVFINQMVNQETLAQVRCMSELTKLVQCSVNNTGVAFCIVCSNFS